MHRLDPSADLLEAARALWPGATLTAADTGTGGPVRARYALVPRADRPQMLVPLDPPGAAAASVRRFSTASTWRDVALRSGVAATLRTAPGLMLRDRIEVRGGGSGLADHLSELLGRPVTFSISIGTPGVNRKPVLQLFDESGGSVGFAKVGWSPATADAVRAEGCALSALSALTLQRVMAPRVLARGMWQGWPVLALEALRPHPWQRPQWRWAPPEVAMDELADHFALPDGPLTDSRWWRRQWQTAARLPDPDLRARFESSLMMVAGIAGERDLAWGAWHGDWTPWNMARSRGAVLVWDWEHFDVGVPRGMDGLHYLVNVMTTWQGVSHRSVLAALCMPSCDQLRRGTDEHVRCLLYLVAVTSRYLRLGESPAGRHIAERANATLTALELLSR